MIVEILLYRLECDKCHAFHEDPEANGKMYLWDSEVDMKTDASSHGWALTHDFHLCNQCKGDGGSH